MSESGRKRTSKWDLKEDAQRLVENVPDRSWPGRAGASFDEKESESGYESYNRRMSPGLDDWRMQSHRHSPKNEWNSLRRSRSRSRSKSPVRGFRQESGSYGRSRGRSRCAQLCRDFAAGRCRRGDSCPYDHQGAQDYDDNWENRRQTEASRNSPPHVSREHPERSGRSLDRRGTSCRYSHHENSNEFRKFSGDEVIRERENDRSRKFYGDEVIRERESDRRHRDDASIERNAEPEYHRRSSVICKFFAAGNCRNGKHCKFSHHGPSRVSPDRRSKDYRMVQEHNLDNQEKPRKSSKWTDANAFSNSSKVNDNRDKIVDAEWGQNSDWNNRGLTDTHNLDDQERSRKFPKWGDANAFSNSSKGNDPRDKVVDAGWGQNSEWNNREVIDTHKAVETSKREGGQSKEENGSSILYPSEPRRDDGWAGDMEMSPEWNYKVKPSNSSMKEEHSYSAHNSQSLISSEPCHDFDINNGRLGSLPDTVLVKQPMAMERSALQQDINLNDHGANTGSGMTTATSHFDLNIKANILQGPSVELKSQNSNAAHFSSLNGAKKSDAASFDEISGYVDGESIKMMGFGEMSTSHVQVRSEDMVSREHLSSLSASLAHFLANGQQLPEIYASLGSHYGADKPAFAKSERAREVDLAVSFEPTRVTEDQKQYDPIFDSQPETSTSPTLRKVIVDEKPQVVIEELRSSISGTNKVHEETVKVSEITKENNTVEDEENNKGQDAAEVVPANGSGMNVDEVGKTGDEKKSKDMKGIRTFKFALAEFVKEILKPTWKEGQMSKEAYKNVVKKSVEKVTGTMQESSIPQTKEKIDQYLSFAKPKLTKLIQAYVEKAQKG